MKYSDLTDFYPARILPHWYGVYEVFPELPSNSPWYSPWYAYWDGEKFCYRAKTVDEAFEKRNCDTGASRYVIWRGLKK